MEKPIMLKREEFIQDISKLINEAQLPPIVVAPILNDLLMQTNMMLQRQYEEEKSQYEKSLKETTEG